MDEFRDLAERMIRMPDHLDEAHYRKKYQAVAHLAHGWLKRVTRGASSILILDAAGHAGEIPPLGRSVLEHVVALRWLVAQGEDIVAPLRTTHYRETERFLEALRKTARGALDEDVFAAVFASTEHDDHGRDHFQQFAHRAAHHGSESDLTTYRALVMESHATYQSTIVYWDSDVRAQLDTSATVIDWPEYAACYLLRGLSAYSEIFIAPPWRRELETIGAAMVLLDPDLEGTLD
jgi:hypothetical protein